MLACMQHALIESPDADELDRLCCALSERADELDARGEWPAEQLRLCGEGGVFRWFVPQAYGGLAWNNADVVRGYLRLSQACLTTTFVITDIQTDAPPGTGLLNDLSTCPECLREMADPSNRRYGYAFTSCAACGPRFTIMADLQYSAAPVTMGRSP